MPSLNGAIAKLVRAHQHFDDFKVEIERIENAIREAGRRVPVRAVYEPDWHRFRVEVDDPPITTDRVGILAGEIIYNLRCALDYLIYELVALDNEGAYSKGTQFPIADDAKKFKKFSKEHRLTVCLAPNRIAQIERHQPYGPADEIRRIYSDPTMPLDRVFALRTGNRQLAILRDLSNLDKHRLLIKGLAVPGTAAICPVRLSDCREPVLDVYIASRLKKGALVCLINVTPTGTNPEMDVELKIDPQVGIPFGPAVPTLEAIAVKVVQVVREFEPFF